MLESEIARLSDAAEAYGEALKAVRTYDDDAGQRAMAAAALYAVPGAAARRRVRSRAFGTPAMADAAAFTSAPRRAAAAALPLGLDRAALVARLLIGVVVALLAVILFAPLIAVFAEALAEGVGAAVASLDEPDARSAIRLTLLVAAIAVPLNAVFGIAAAWAIAKFDFRGKAFLITLHRPAVLGLAGGRRPLPRAALRRATARSAPGSSRTASRSSSRCRASCSPPCS